MRRFEGGAGAQQQQPALAGQESRRQLQANHRPAERQAEASTLTTTTLHPVVPT